MLTTGNQLKAARMLAEFDQLPLAEAAGVSVGTIRNMEAQGAKPLKSSLALIRAVMVVLEAAGVEFLNHGQPGVRLRKKVEPSKSNDGLPEGHAEFPMHRDPIL